MICKICNTIIGEFKRINICKICYLANRRAERARLLSLIKENITNNLKLAFKECKQCKNNLLYENFKYVAHSKDGLKDICNICISNKLIEENQNKINSTKEKQCITCKNILKISNFKLFEKLNLRGDKLKYITNRCNNCENDRCKKIRKENWKNTSQEKRDAYNKWRRENTPKKRNAGTINTNKIKRKIRENISNYVRKSIKSIGGIKSGSFFTAVGYSFKEFKAHIENHFKFPGNEWMKWENYGAYNPKTWNDNDKSTWVWQLDHIIPHSKFNYKDMKCQEFKDCWKLENLRPLSAKENLMDGVYRIRH